MVHTFGLAAVFLAAITSLDARASVTWISVEQAVQRSEADGKKIFVYLYTHWTGWGVRMDREVFSDPEIAQYINAHFHPVRLDGETKRPITLVGRTFRFLPDAGRRGYHELPHLLLDGKMAYPAMVFLTPELQRIPPILAGYQRPADMMAALHYVATDRWKTVTLREFKEGFSWRPAGR